MPILRATMVERQTYTAELEITPEEADGLITDQNVDNFVDAHGSWKSKFVEEDDCNGTVESWEITEE